MIASAYSKMTLCAAVPTPDLPEASHARGSLLRLPLPPDLQCARLPSVCQFVWNLSASFLIETVPRSQHREQTGEAL